MTRRAIPRRHVLRGLGCAVALPWLEALPWLARSGARAFAGEASPPLRLAFLYVPNGVDIANWTPATEGRDYDLPAILKPLAPVRDEVLVLSGLTHDKARANGDGPGDHARAGATFLTGCQARKTAGEDIHVGTSVDQVAAQALGNATTLPSMELGVEGGRQAGSCDSGYSCAYSSSISWRTSRMPMGKEIHPRLAFERLFAFGGDASKAAVRRRATRKSILDYVADDARRVERRLGGADRRKLDEYLAAVRQLELRLERAERMTDPAAPGRPPERLPEDYGEHVRLLLDVIVLAFRADLTRIVTFMLANEGSNHAYHVLGVKGGHHEISHDGGDETKRRFIRAINTFHVAQLTYLLQSLKALPEGAGTVLDHCLVVYGSAISDGNRHNHDDLPVLLAGRGGGTVVPGRHVRYPHETPMCNLYLSLLDRVGVEVPSFGDATGRLPGLEA